MCRILVWGLVLLVPLPVAWSQESKKDDAKAMKFAGELSPDDAKDKVTKHPQHVHTVKMKAGQMYQIDLVSKAFDAYLRVEDASGKELAQNDDRGAGTLDSRIYFKVPKDGTYRLIATSFDGKTGPYTLTAKAASGKAVDANAALSAAQSELQKKYLAANAKLNADYVNAKTDDARDKALAAFSKEMESLAGRFAKVAKDYPDENAGKQAAQMAQQVRFMGQSMKSQIMITAGNALRAQYEKAYQDKAKNADELYKKAQSYFAEAAKKHAGNSALANQFKDGLYLLEHLSVGKAAPEIKAEDLDGKEFKLSDYRGKVVVLDFWGNW